MSFKSNSWEARDLRAVLHGFSDLKSLHDNGPVVVSHGEGIYVYDIHGRCYLDSNSGLWNVIAGFDHQGLIETACEQIRKFPAYHSFFGRISEPSIELAERLLEIAPAPMSKVFFANSGSEANDTAVKMLWMINRGLGQPERRKIISRHFAYHGVTAVSASLTGKDYVGAFGLPLEGFIFADCPHYWRYGLEGETENQYTARLAKNLEELIEKEGPHTIAGFIAEPVMGAGGVLPPPEGYFAAIQPILQHYDIPLIADEVICGFGRTGKLWGCQTYQIKPDIVTASKCLTSGFYPLSAVLVSEAIHDRLMQAAQEFEEFPHGFTMGGNPVGCAIGLKAIDVILNEGVLDNLIEVAPYFQKKLQTFGDHPCIGEVRGIGLMGALEMVADKQSKAPFPPHQAVGDQIANQALANGLICRPIGSAIVLAPPFIISREQIDELGDKLDRTIRQVFSDVS